ncbi:hypothetical protein CDQ84_13640 [Clostridium thermosuccinogenes]|uniref:Uncharacterized protein n=1 Tax=Clostridium thermosuccinogenes TaxID=84032 RepID=A0A2K2F5H6_9CLOT|nr:hypothetical protein [Pseudoclostridium thermosuccinogenes]AUS97786.1 hypothetical protein CDO33_15860 [Pseudoclostridium thermosuccinogenes]PNT94027.1 hypothetical protein CDQ83_11265 [Pseudoclostridium thermosuccinogenes]PNT95878.1 hypothetical protein CDQ85_13555 [Pseudoclostridium thermosuccinogenes]PNT97220.1 hypothetical protein CDQ84_13640 [Pseudoclostridium thermosuccinogenes]
MRSFGYTIGTLLKRPFIIVYFSLVALAICTFNLYFPVLDVIVNLGTFNSNDVLSSIVYLMQLVLKLILTPQGILALLAFIAVASLLISFLFSGWLYLINNTLDHKKKVKAELLIGIGKYFKRMFLISLVSVTLGVVFIIICLVASVPAFVITRAAVESKPELFVSALIIDLITLGVLFFAAMFFRIYISFWYIAALNHEKKSFYAGKKRADSKFWLIVRSLLVFDIIFVVFQSAFMYADRLMGDDIVLFIGKWIFSTIFPTLLIIYMFVLFKKSPDGGEK